jgi:hypothetical protein
MSKRERRVGAGAATLLLLVVLAFVGCGGDEGGPEANATPRQVEPSLEAQAVAFLEREGTALRRNLRRFLGPTLTTAVEPDSAVCRSARQTPSITDPRKHPFACIVRASADGQGLEVEIVLGFVGTELDGRCWRAANERVAVTTSLPELLSRREAQLPVNQVAGCV